jgi:hypothetical protein
MGGPATATIEPPANKRSMTDCTRSDALCWLARLPDLLSLAPPEGKLLSGGVFSSPSNLHHLADSLGSESPRRIKRDVASTLSVEALLTRVSSLKVRAGILSCLHTTVSYPSRKTLPLSPTSHFTENSLKNYPQNSVRKSG